MGYVCAAPPGSRYPRKPEKSVRFPGVVDNVLRKLDAKNQSGAFLRAVSVVKH